MPFTFAFQDYGEQEGKPLHFAQMKQSMKYLKEGGEKKPYSTDDWQQKVVCQNCHLLSKLVL